MRRIISSEKPLFLIHQLDGISVRELWRLLPDDLRPYVAVQLDLPKPKGPESVPKLREKLKVAQATSIPVFFTVQTWRETSDTYIPIEELDKMLSEFPNLVGLRSCELSCFSLNDIQKEYQPETCT